MFGGAIGGDTALTGLTVSGTTAINGGSVTTTGDQAYTGAATLGADAALTTTDGAVTFGGTLDGAHALTITTASGTITFTGAVGGTTTLTALTVTDGTGTLAIDGGSIATTGAQSYATAVVLGADTTLTGATVTLSGGLDAATAGGQSLAIVGNAVVDQAVGATVALGTVSVSGTTVFGDPAVTTTGDQTYAGAVTLGADTTLTSTGGTITLAAGADGTTAGGQSLIIVGNTALTGAFGGTTALNALSVTGTAALNGGVTTAASQTYLGAVTLAGDTTLTGGDTVAFAATVDGGHALVITGGNAVTFSGVVGGTSRLGDLTVNTSGATTFDGAVTAASVTTDVPGTLFINGGSVDTTGTQTYGERAVIGADTTLAGTLVSLNGGADALATPVALVIQGDASLAGGIGANAALTGLSVSGATTVTADTHLVTTGGVTFTGALNTGSTLIVDANSGDVTFAAINGAGTLVVNTSGATTFGGAVQAAAITTDASGTLFLNGGSVTTTGAQTFGERAVLGTDTVLTGATVTLAAGADGATAGGQSLAVAGDLVAGGALGGTTALRQLSVSGTSAVNGGSVTTTGDQTYTGAVTLGGDAILTGGTVTLLAGGDAATAGGQSLAIVGNGVLAGAFGANQALNTPVGQRHRHPERRFHQRHRHPDLHRCRGGERRPVADQHRRFAGVRRHAGQRQPVGPEPDGGRRPAGDGRGRRHRPAGRPDHQHRRHRHLHPGGDGQQPGGNRGRRCHHLPRHAGGGRQRRPATDGQWLRVRAGGHRQRRDDRPGRQPGRRHHPLRQPGDGDGGGRLHPDRWRHLPGAGHHHGDPWPDHLRDGGDPAHGHGHHHHRRQDHHGRPAGGDHGPDHVVGHRRHGGGPAQRHGAADHQRRQPEGGQGGLGHDVRHRQGPWLGPGGQRHRQPAARCTLVHQQHPLGPDRHGQPGGGDGRRPGAGAQHAGREQPVQRHGDQRRHHAGHPGGLRGPAGADHQRRYQWYHRRQRPALGPDRGGCRQPDHHPLSLKQSDLDQTMSTNALPAFYQQPRPIAAERDGDTSLTPVTDYKFAATANSVPLIAAEFTLACKQYPILFVDGAAAQPVALFGLRNGENLFVDADGTWAAGAYIPAYVRRYPFIFMENRDKSEFTLCIDEAAPVVGKGGANKLFQDGQPTEVTRNALAFCSDYQGHYAVTTEFVAALVKADLLVENRADVTLKDGQKLSLAGFKVIDEAKFNALPAEEFLRWRERGWLHLVICHFISVSNWAALVDLAAKHPAPAAN
ncbi:MAG: SapC family protein [Azospirillaceae bacterium]|nr:SapC family protein [Azospirillaceae bacterium]